MKDQKYRVLAVTILAILLLMGCSQRDETQINDKKDSDSNGSVISLNSDKNPLLKVPKAKNSEFEISNKTTRPRLMSSRGLVIMQNSSNKRWHFVQQRVAIPYGNRLRIADNADFGALVQGSDGSKITIDANTELVYRSERHIELKYGKAYFNIAPQKTPFIITTPRGKAIVLGTEFALGTRNNQKNGAVFCDVVDGKVQLISSKNKKAVLDAGKSAVMNEKGIRVVTAVPGSGKWLQQIKALLSENETVAQLVASAGKEGAKLPLEMNSYHIDVTVVDGIARTFIDMVFVNHTDRRLEGTFYYPLPAKATVSQFQMYVGDKLVVGEVLERYRARRIFEYIRRQRRDPALLEWVGGNLFKMRVFPIEPRSEKRIQLGYTQVLSRHKGKTQYTFPLVSEMLEKNPLHDLKITFKLLSSLGIDKLSSSSHKVKQKISKDKTRGALAFQVKEYTPKKDFTVTWKVPTTKELLSVTNRRVDEKESYFLARLEPQVQAKPRELPQRLLLVVDGSASVGARNYSVASEFAIAIAEMLDKAQLNVVIAKHDSYFKNADFHHCTPHSTRTFLKQRKPLGGTDLLQSFATIANKLSNEKTHIIYLGDGIDNLGSDEGKVLVTKITELFTNKNVELSTVAIGSSYDEMILKGIAVNLGGAFHRVEDVKGAFSTADAILEEFSRPVLRKVEVEFTGVEIAGVYPKKLGTVIIGDTQTIVGRILREGKGSMAIVGQVDGQTVRREYPIHFASTPEENQFLPRLWAQAHMGWLQSQMGIVSKKRDKYLKQEIINTSIRYQIMSPYTAFLVLESEEDYKRYGINRRMRMVDWRGKLAGVTRRDPSVSVKLKPLPKIPKKIKNLRPLFIPEPLLNLWGKKEEITMERHLMNAYSYGLYDKGRGDIRYSLGKAQSMKNGFDVLPGEDSTEDEGIFPDTEEEDNSAQPQKQSPQRKAPKKDEEIGEDLDDFVDGESLNVKEISADPASSTPMPIVASGPSFAKGNNMLQMKRDAIGGGRRARRVYPGHYRSNKTYLDRYSIRALVLKNGQQLLIPQLQMPSLYLRRAVQLHPGGLKERLVLVVMSLRDGQRSYGLAELEILLKQIPDNVHLFLEKAYQLKLEGKTKLSYECVLQALVVAKEQKKADLRERCAYELSTHAKYQDASKEFEALADKCQEVNRSIALYIAAFNQARNGGIKDRISIIDKMLSRWPKSGYGYQQASNTLNYEDPKRALLLVEKAQQLGVDNWYLSFSILLRQKQPEKAWKIWRNRLKKTTTTAQAYSIIQQGYNLKQKETWDIVENFDKLSGIIRDGAVHFAVNNHNRIDEKLEKKLIDFFAKNKVAPQVRISAFHFFQNRLGKGPKTLAILQPLLEKHSSVKVNGYSIQAIGQMTNHGYHQEAEPFLTAMLKRTDLTQQQQYQLSHSYYRILIGTQRQKTAYAHLEKCFLETKVESHAYYYLNQILSSLFQNGRGKRAVELVMQMFTRFPNHANNHYLYQNLVNYANRDPKVIEQFRDIVKDQQDKDKYHLQYREAIEFIQQQQYQTAYDKLDTLKNSLLSEHNSLAKEINTLYTQVQQLTNKVQQQKDQKTKNKIYQELQKIRQQQTALYRQYGLYENLLRKVHNLLPRIAARDEVLQAFYLKKCTENVKKEDPIVREWTNRILQTLHYQNDKTAYCDFLIKLYQKEPNDPIWPRLLVNAYITVGNAEKAKKILEKLSANNPQEYQLALSLYHLAVNDESEKVNMIRKRLLKALSKQPNVLSRYASQWQSDLIH